MVHKPKHKVHSFKGLLGDGGQDEINLERSNLNLAYRITKFDVFPSTPFGVGQQSTVRIFKESQGTPGATVDFGDPDLLAAACLGIHDGAYFGTAYITIFDNVLFSRNIFINLFNDAGTPSINYYIEIEEVPISASALIQLKLGTARRIKTKESMG